MDIKPLDRVVLRQKQLHGNLNTLLDAEVVSISGSAASIILDGDDAPTTVPLADLTKQTDIYGSELSRPNEYPVINAIRR